jgi:hypothetical protein
VRLSVQVYSLSDIKLRYLYNRHVCAFICRTEYGVILRFALLQMWQQCATAYYICAKMLAICMCLCARACRRAGWRVECGNRFLHEIIDDCVKQFNWIGTPQREFESARRIFSLFTAKNKHIPLLQNAWMKLEVFCYSKWLFYTLWTWHNNEYSLYLWDSLIDEKCYEGV